MAWTPERVKTLEEMWKGGKTASEIAETLGDVTRNAVIGKAHRMGLSGRPSPIKKAPAQSAASTSTPTATPPKAAPKKRAAPAPKKKKGDTKITILDLSERMCRWPYGDPKIEEEFYFCGDQVRTGAVYCEKHCGEAYQPHTKKRAKAPPPRT